MAGQTSDLLQIIQLAQMRVPPTMNRKQALETYMKTLSDAGLTSVTLVSPSGEVVAWEIRPLKTDGTEAA